MTIDMADAPQAPGHSHEIPCAADLRRLEERLVTLSSVAARYHAG